eukprot:scaffold2623_cov78-Phaeocystis_antarctica.AAC.7
MKLEPRWALADPGSRIFPPFSVHARGELGADSGSRIFPCSALCPCPSGRLRTPDLGSWIVRLAPHTVSAKPDPGFWISTSSDSGLGALRRRGSRTLDAGCAPYLR